MKQTKQFLRPLLMAIVMMVGMLVPQGAWAQYLEVWEEETKTISSDASYDEIYVYPGGVLIINEGVTLTLTSGLYIYGDDNMNLYGTVINYGTIIGGDGYIDMQGGVLANHGHIDLGGANGYGTFYNTGTLGEYIYLTPTEECNHAEYEDLGTVEATCTHGAGTQYRCYTCYYMRLDETSGALQHNIDSHNGMNICSSCGHTTYDAPDNGDGSEEYPYQIANAGNLYWFADYTRNEDNYANAILTADIVLNDGTFATDGTFTATGADEPSKPFPWICIGGVNGSYGGTFDGNGHTISGMYVNDSFGLFYDLSGSVVNLGIVNCYIRVYDYTGAICHWNKGTISNCYTTGILSGSFSSGICDTNTDIYSTISNCYSTCTFVYDSYFYGGGICGTNSGTISNCYTSDNTTIQYNNATASEVYGGVSANRFASGEIAYKLNGSVDGEGHWTAGATDGKQAWYQKLGEDGDSYPVLAAAEGNTVYYGYENCLSESETYSNDLRYAEKEDAHDFTSHTLTDGPVTSGLYAYVCDRDCGAHSDNHIIKDFNGEGNHLELTTDGEGNYSTSENIILADANGFASPIDFTAASVTYNRNIVMDDGMYSFIVPFDIPADQAAELGTFYQYSKHEEGNVYFDNADGIVRANTAYFFKPAKDITSITVENPTFGTTGTMPDATNPSEPGLYGTYSQIDIPVGAYGYGYMGFFVKAGTGNKIKPFRAYLWLGNGASMAKALAFFGDYDDITGINNIETDTDLDMSKPIYTLSGQRIMTPKKGEIYIQNGKKVMKK